jgi:hypothetical protein
MFPLLPILAVLLGKAVLGNVGKEKEPSNEKSYDHIDCPGEDFWKDPVEKSTGWGQPGNRPIPPPPPKKMTLSS